MFAGLVEQTASLIRLEERDEAWLLEVENPYPQTAGLNIGESIAVNGCCLSLTQYSAERLSFDLLEETLRRTSLQNYRMGNRVNLERSLRAEDRLGGHFVSGHVDACGEIIGFEQDGKNHYLRIQHRADGNRYVVSKGCIAIEGASLTVVEPQPESFGVWLIPHTMSHTNLQERTVGDQVNLEYDLLAKYVEKLLPAAQNPYS